MEQYALKATLRSAVGHSAPRALRRQSRTPAVLYGPETHPMPLSVDAKELMTSLQKRSRHPLLTLQIEGDDRGSRPVMLKEVQVHPVSRTPLHVDFYEVSEGRKIRVKVPVEVSGKAQGVELGGMLQIIRRELEVFCLPKDIPECIRVDVTELGVAESIHVEDLKLEGAIEIPHETNFTVLTLLSPKASGGPEGAEGGDAAAGEKSEGDKA